MVAGVHGVESIAKLLHHMFAPVMSLRSNETRMVLAKAELTGRSSFETNEPRQCRETFQNLIESKRPWAAGERDDPACPAAHLPPIRRLLL